MMISITASSKKFGRNKKLLSILKPIGAAVFWLLLWEFLYIIVGKDVILPSPANTVKVIADVFFTVAFWTPVFNTMFRILEGFLLAVFCGAVFAVITNYSSLMRALLTPLFSIIKAAPVASFIILMLIWLPDNAIPVWASFMMVFPIVWGNVSKGLSNISSDLKDMSKAFKVPFFTRLKRIYIPSVMPYFMAGATTAVGMSWKAGLAAEVLCTPQSAIGTNLYNAKIYLLTEEVFAWTIVIIILSIIIEKVFVKLMQRIGKRYNVSEGQA